MSSKLTEMEELLQLLNHRIDSARYVIENQPFLRFKDDDSLEKEIEHPEYSKGYLKALLDTKQNWFGFQE